MPRPFLPRWRATLGPVIEEGYGVLSPRIFRQKDLLEAFELIFQGIVVRVDLMNGKVWFCPNGAEPQLQCDPKLPSGTKFRLIWFRRMGMSSDKLNLSPECLFYGVGWQTTIEGRNLKFGYIVKQDGDSDDAEFYEGLP